jgi:hypothetical protein
MSSLEPLDKKLTVEAEDSELPGLILKSLKWRAIRIIVMVSTKKH